MSWTPERICPHCARKTAEMEYLKEQVRQLRAEAENSWRAPFELRLTAAEARMLAYMVRHPRIVTDEQLITASRSPFLKDEPEPKLSQVFVCKIRRKLEPFGLKIHTHWGEGYRLDPDSRQRLLNWPAEGSAAA